MRTYKLTISYDGSSDDRMTHTMNPAIRSAVCKGSWKRLLISISSPQASSSRACDAATRKPLLA